MKLGIGRITLSLGVVVLAGCASRSAINFAPATPTTSMAATQPAAQPAQPARAEKTAEIAAPAEPQPLTADSISIGSLPTEDVALLDLELAFDSEFGYQLPPQHVMGSPAFHCVSGEESLGCAARPAATEETTAEKSDEPVLVARNSKEGEAQ